MSEQSANFILCVNLKVARFMASCIISYNLFLQEW